MEARDLARANTGGLFKGAVPLLTGSHRACKVLGSKSHRTVDRLHSVLTNEDDKKFTHQKTMLYLLVTLASLYVFVK